MKKVNVLVVAALVAVMFSGCGRIDRAVAGVTGEPVEICHKGVLYLQATSGMSVMYTPDGQIATCQ